MSMSSGDTRRDANASAAGRAVIAVISAAILLALIHLMIRYGNVALYHAASLAIMPGVLVEMELTGNSTCQIRRLALAAGDHRRDLAALLGRGIYRTPGLAVGRRQADRIAAARPHRGVRKGPETLMFNLLLLKRFGNPMGVVVKDIFACSLSVMLLRNLG